MCLIKILWDFPGFGNSFSGAGMLSSNRLRRSFAALAAISLGITFLLKKSDSYEGL